MEIGKVWLSTNRLRAGPTLRNVKPTHTLYFNFTHLWHLQSSIFNLLGSHSKSYFDYAEKREVAFLESSWNFIEIKNCEHDYLEAFETLKDLLGYPFTFSNCLETLKNACGPFLVKRHKEKIPREPRHVLE